MYGLVSCCSCNIFRRITFLVNTTSKHIFSRPGLNDLRRPSSSQSILDVNTNVVKDVLLYKSDSVKQIKMLNAFALAQFTFWNYLAHTVFYTMKSTPVDETNNDGPWYSKVNLGEDSMRYSLTAICLSLGNGLLLTALLFTTRAVKYIVLKKGGKNIDLITFGPLFTKDKVLSVPLREVSANAHRSDSRVTLPLKVKGKPFFYIIDMSGKFGNLRLFDATIGLRRF